MNVKIIFAVLIFLVVINSVYFIRMNQERDVVDDSGTSGPLEDVNVSNETIENVGPLSNAITTSALGEHNSRDDCWVSFEGKVYDITSYLPRHPGGVNRILNYCGTSSGFENAFTGQHGQSKVSLLMKVGVFIGDFDVLGEIQ
ncbi:MAG: cytochrome b5-like heme/steroid binding domain-containing protein [Nanoarchaeota archaeon]